MSRPSIVYELTPEWYQRYLKAEECISYKGTQHLEILVTYPINKKDTLIGIQPNLKTAIKLVEKLDSFIDPRNPNNYL